MTLININSKCNQIFGIIYTANQYISSSVLKTGTELSSELIFLQI